MRRAHSGLSVVLAIAASIAGAGVARAASFRVNSTADAVDSHPGDGLCEIASGTRVCTLRAAVQEANALAAAGRHETTVIELPAGTYALSRVGAGEDAAATGDLDLNTSLQIRGAGAATTVIDGAGADRIFDVASAPTGPVARVAVTLTQLTIRGGYADVHGGGGVRFASPLTLRDVIVRENVSQGRGGGVGSADSGHAEPRLRIADSVVEDNVALASGASGGGIDATSATHFSLERTAVRRNRARGHGGGVAAALRSERARFEQATITDNTAGDGGLGRGGGLWTGCAAIERSVISGNHASGNGGGIQLSGDCGAVIVDTAIRGNTSGTAGGGLGDGGEIALSEVDRSAAPAGGDRFGPFSRTAVYHSVLSLNLPSDCAGRPVSSLGYNIDSDGSCALAAATDVAGLEPLLPPPVDHLATAALADSDDETESSALAAAASSLAVLRTIDGDARHGTASALRAFEVRTGNQKLPREPKSPPRDKREKLDAKCP